MPTSLLTHSAPANAVVLTVVSSDTFKVWEKQQSQAVRNWFKATNFRGAPASHAIIPNHEGDLSRVVVGVHSPVSLWDLAALPRRLPDGTYVLEGVKKAEDEAKLALGWLLGAYRESLHKLDDTSTARLCVSKKVDIKSIETKAAIITRTRAVITTPAEDFGPEELAAYANQIAKAHKAKTSQIVGEELLAKNYPAIYTVGRASPRLPRLIDLRWGNPKNPKVTFVGKGVCFDTGGLNLKPGSGMQLMRKDMGGAAVALGVADLVMTNKLPVCLRVLIPAVDNNIGGNAYRPSDIITMRNGLKVEVGNTDAEGRLVVADALAEASREKPDLLIDFATFGPARGIFGPEMASFFTNDETIARDLTKLGGEEEDYVWRLPLHAPYADMLRTPFADVNSAPGAAYAGAMTLAMFLEKFIDPTLKRIHLDFMAWNTSGKAGRPEGGEAMTLRTAYALLEKMFATK